MSRYSGAHSPVDSSRCACQAFISLAADKWRVCQAQVEQTLHHEQPADGISLRAGELCSGAATMPSQDSSAAPAPVHAVTAEDVLPKASSF